MHRSIRNKNDANRVPSLSKIHAVVFINTTLSVELHKAADTALFSHSFINCYQFAHFITSLKSLFEFTNRSGPKILTIIF